MLIAPIELNFDTQAGFCVWDMTCNQFALFSGCPKVVRADFNDKLVRFLSNEFMEYVQRSSPSSEDKVPSQLLESCLNLKK